MKHVYPSDKIAHMWANQVQDNARNSTNNFYYNYGIIYSYGNHFPIARLNDGAILFTNRKYSVTTSKHVSNAYYALSQPQRQQLIYVNDPDLNPTSGQSTILHWLTNELKLIISDLKDRRTVIGKARKPEKYISDFHGIVDNMEKLISYATKLANLKINKRDEYLLASPNTKAGVKSLIKQARKLAVIDNLAELQDKIKAQAAKEKAARASTLAQAIEKFKAFDPHYRSVHGGEYTYLRVSPSGVETSRGIQIPETEARLLYTAFKRGKLIGQRFDHYTITKVDTDKQLIIAGCHLIPFAEVEEAAAKLGIKAA